MTVTVADCGTVKWTRPLGTEMVIHWGWSYHNGQQRRQTGKLHLLKVRPEHYLQFVTTWNILNLHLLELWFLLSHFSAKDVPVEGEQI